MEDMDGVKVYLGLGSNLGDRQAMLVDAAILLESQGFRLLNRSGVYETAPWGNHDQASFLNQVLVGKWEGSPLDLLNSIHEVEAGLGRVREEIWGPRTIDIDILGMGDTLLKSQRLTIPHPYLHERAFVLIPLAEVAPDWEVPGTNKTVSEALADLPEAETTGVKAL